MATPVFEALCHLVHFDLYLRRGEFQVLHQKVRGCRLGKEAKNQDAQSICHAIDVASIWYWKEVLCLQRSAATTCLLRRYGIPAQLVIGAQSTPFRAHAWVEVAGQVINDKPYIREMYSVLERC
jgi:hypothetical protein